MKAPLVLDACCGSRMFWFDRKDERAVFVDKRSSYAWGLPDVIKVLDILAAEVRRLRGTAIQTIPCTHCGGTGRFCTHCDGKGRTPAATADKS